MSTNLLYVLNLGVGVLISFGIALWVFKRDKSEN
jgi:hypothetical protein